jgi:hypothetical protein
MCGKAHRLPAALLAPAHRTIGGEGEQCQMNKILVAGIACIGLAGPATLAAGGLLSSTGEVIAIMAGELFTGTAKGHLDGAGTITIHSQKDPALTCSGQFTSSAELGGQGTLLCSDGSSATYKFQRLTIYRGHGTGRFSRGPMSFTYGITAEKAVPYLELPKGKKLARNGTGLELVSL